MRTVRLAAQARNRPRARLAWLLLVAILLLIALAARASAATPADLHDRAGPRFSDDDSCAVLTDPDADDELTADFDGDTDTTGALAACANAAGEPDRKLSAKVAQRTGARAVTDERARAANDNEAALQRAADAVLDAAGRGSLDDDDLVGAGGDTPDDDDDLVGAGGDQPNDDRELGTADGETPGDGDDLVGASGDALESGATGAAFGVFDGDEELAFASAVGFVDTADLYDAQQRHQRPPRWGRLDLTVTWRHRLREAGDEDPVGVDAFLVTAEWRR